MKLSTARIVVLLIALVGLAAVTAACGGSGDERSAVVAHAEPRWPDSTLRDWVSYADQVSVVRVISESRIDPPSDVIERGEGYVGRRITIEVESTIWGRGFHEVNGRVTMLAPGWAMHDSKEYPFVPAGGSRGEVGHRYLAPLVLTDEGDWTIFSFSGLFPLFDDRISEDRRAGTAEGQIAKQIVGLTVPSVTEMLAKTDADPLAVKYGILSPDARVEAVYKEKDRALESGSG